VGLPEPLKQPYTIKAFARRAQTIPELLFADLKQPAPPAI